MKNIFLQTQLKPGVLLRETFSHTPDEARSVGLAKACVPLKIDSVIEKLVPRIKTKQNEKSTCMHFNSCFSVYSVCLYLSLSINVI